MSEFLFFSCPVCMGQFNPSDIALAPQLDVATQRRCIGPPIRRGNLATLRWVSNQTWLFSDVALELQPDVAYETDWPHFMSAYRESEFG